MAPRTNPAKVEELLLDQYDSTKSLTIYIRAAGSLVDKVAAADTTGVLSTSDLGLLETYLAAHFYQAGPDQGLAQKQTGRASGTYLGQTGMYLDSTFFGQQAILLDTTGFLSNLNLQARRGTKRIASLIWLGTADEANTTTE